MIIMKSFFKSLPFKLLLGVIIGISAGLFSNEVMMNIIVSVRYILNQVIIFCVPLIIIGFIAPSITRLGSSASKMLGIALFLAYISSIGAAFFSAFSSYVLIPHLSIASNIEGLKELPPLVFKLDIPHSCRLSSL